MEVDDATFTHAVTTSAYWKTALVPSKVGARVGGFYVCVVYRGTEMVRTMHLHRRYPHIVAEGCEVVYKRDLWDHIRAMHGYIEEIGQKWNDYWASLSAFSD